METLQTKCKTCGETFRTEDELVRHGKTHETTQYKEKSDSHSCGCCFE
ncbi:MAG: C2H2-type zinc finger protein [Nitrosotalea sp.]